MSEELDVLLREPVLEAMAGAVARKLAEILRERGERADEGELKRQFVRTYSALLMKGVVKRGRGRR